MSTVAFVLLFPIGDMGACGGGAGSIEYSRLTLSVEFSRFHVGLCSLPYYNLHLITKLHSSSCSVAVSYSGLSIVSSRSVPSTSSTKFLLVFSFF